MQHVTAKITLEGVFAVEDDRVTPIEIAEAVQGWLFGELLSDVDDLTALVFEDDGSLTEAPIIVVAASVTGTATP